MKQSILIPSALCIISILLASAFYPGLPEKIASHWNASGEVDGYMPKLVGTALFPAMMVFMSILFLLIPRIDPLKKNIEKFGSYYSGFIVVMLLFFLMIQLQVLLWNSGLILSMNLTIPLGLGILLYYCGILFEHSKRNWFIGIRTPWTLSSDKVWEKTHMLGAKIFKACGVISLFSVLIPEYSIILVIAPLIAGSLFLVIYSYIEFHKQ